MLLRTYFTAAAIAATSTFGVGAAIVGKSLRGRDPDIAASANKDQHRVLQEEEEVTFLIADIQYEDGVTATSRKLQGNSNSQGRGNRGNNPNKPERTMNVQDSHGMIYEIEAGSGDTAGASSGSKVTLPSNAFMAPGTKKINLGGGALKKKMTKKMKPNKKRDLQEDDSSTELRRHLTSIGTKTVVAVRIIASGGAYNWTDEAGLSEDVFGIGTSEDGFNLKTGYEGCSHNQLIINPGGGGYSDINDGVTTITVETAATSGNNGDMANAVTAAIKAKFGVSDPTDIADHWLYCMPPGVMTGIAYAFVDHWMSVYSNEWCNYPSSQMHELGHNFGFDHSNEGTHNYGDQSGMMGSSYSEDEGPMMCFNAAKSWQTGWFNDKRVNMNIGGSGATDNCLETDITGQADYVDGTDQTVLVKMNRASSLGRDLFLMYNKRAGINSGTVEGGNTVMVVEADAEGTGYAQSWLMGKLGAGASQTFAGYLGDPRDLVITVLSIGDTARVKIEFDGLCTNTIAPTPSPCENPNQKQVSVQIATDNYPEETSWTLKKVGSCAGQTDLNLSSPTYSTANAVHAAFEQCVDKGQYEFTITDAYNDGMCCSYGAGSFQVFYGDRDVFEGQGGDFGTSFTGNFGECDVPASPPPSPAPAPVNPTPPPSPAPVNPPTSLPTSEPTNPPSPQPTNPPSPNPTPLPTNPSPTNPPTKLPTPLPTNPPSPNPTAEPTNPPPTNVPTNPPTPMPTNPPTPNPTNVPTNPPTPLPTSPPSPAPTNPPVAVVDKYICTKNAPLPATICADGSLTGGKCSTANAFDSCGNGGKRCWWASCPGDVGGPPPTPTTPPPSPSPPTGLCPACAYGPDGVCCGNCVDSGKPGNRGCF